jgi:hypothetical protein
VTGPRPQRHGRAEHAGDAIDDREPEPEALHRTAQRLVLALPHAIELLEDAVALRVLDARSGVPDLDPQPVAAPAHADEHAAALGVADRVRQEVLQDPAEQPRIGADDRPRAAEVQRESARVRLQPELRVERTEQLVDREVGHLRLHRAGVQLRDVEQVGQHAFRRAQALLEVGEQRARLAVSQLRRERPSEQPAACSGCSRS